MSWRLHRMTRYERETIALSQERVEEDLAEAKQYRSYYGAFSLEPSDPEDVRRAYESARKIQRLLNKLPTLPDDKRLSAEGAKSIFWALWGQVDEEVKLEEISIPSIPETIELETLEEYDVSWTVSLVREGIAAIASSAGEEVEKLLDAAIRITPAS